MECHTLRTDDKVGMDLWVKITDTLKNAILEDLRCTQASARNKHRSNIPGDTA